MLFGRPGGVVRISIRRLRASPSTVAPLSFHDRGGALPMLSTFGLIFDTSALVLSCASGRGLGAIRPCSLDRTGTPLARRADDRGALQLADTS